MTSDVPQVECDRARRAWRDRWGANRARTRAFFGEILTEGAYYERPIALRHPFVFYDGHLAAFVVNVLLKQVLGRPGIDADLEILFARGIDPEKASLAPELAWPARDTVKAYVARVEEAVEEILDTAPEDVLREAVPLVLEHEEMHQETLLYMLHRLPLGSKRRPAGASPLETSGERPTHRAVHVAEGCAALGARRRDLGFGWDNEFPRSDVLVPSFEIDAHAVTNADWLEFMDAGGYATESLWSPEARAWRQEAGVSHPAFWIRKDGGWAWRGQFDEIRLPPAWPVYVSHAEARAYAAWRGRRLPSEPQFHRAAFSSPRGDEVPYPWGSEPPSSLRGNFGFRQFDPVPCGSRPEGASAWGVHDLVGNGWEWTSTPFGPLPGFEPMPLYPVYSADFFDGRHFVLKGASPATAEPLVRRSFRNWFQPHYPFVYAKFRTVAG